ncbi:MAG: CPBP family intramembrane metalloprotease [Clostridia bacterium]|nr:CPBP family intramembrane metalloprotease [Clostridia bacterium]
MKLNRKASLLFLICVGLYLALSFALVLLLPSITAETAFLLNAFMLSIPAFLIPALIFRRKNRFPFFPAPRFSHVMLAVLLGIGCVYMNEALMSLNNAVFFGIEIHSNATSAETILGMSTWSMIVALAVIPPISEEFIMRGALLEAWRRYSPVGAAFLTSVLFALLHSAPSAFIIYFGIGLMLAAIYLISRNVWLTVIVHFVNNFASVLAALSMRSNAAPGAEQADLVAEGQSMLASLTESRAGCIGMFIIYAVIASLFIVPCMIALKRSCMRHKLGMYKEEAAETDPDGAVLTDAAPDIRADGGEYGSMWSDGVLWGVIAVLIVLNVVTGLQEFGVIKLGL